MGLPDDDDYEGSEGNSAADATNDADPGDDTSDDGTTNSADNDSSAESSDKGSTSEGDSSADKGEGSSSSGETKLEMDRVPSPGTIDFTKIIDAWREGDIDDSIQPKVSELAPESLAQITVGPNSDSGQFENFDQQANQLYQILSTTMKTTKELENAVKRNML